MRTRRVQVIVRLNEREHAELIRRVKKTGLTQAAYFRLLIGGNAPKEAPPLDYYNILRELHSIGTNINQLAKTANAIGNTDAALFTAEAARLRAALLEIQRAVELPDKIHGDNED